MIRSRPVRNVPLLSLALAVLVVGLVLVAACGRPVRQAAPAASWDGHLFDDLKWCYMVALDDRPADETAASLRMEEALGKEVEAVLAAHAAGALRTEAERADAGLVLVYDALLLQRNLAHATRGKIDRQALPGDATSRRRRAVELLELATTLRPADGRVASWLAATRGMADVGPDGEMTDARKNALLAAVDVAPSFNLFTAYIAMRDEPLDTAHGTALFAKTRAFLESRECRDVKPGSAEARRCEGSPIAPDNLQGATVMLGDQFLRRGEEALRRGSIPEAPDLLGTASGIYASLSSERHRDVTARWSKADLLDARMRRLAALEPGGAVPNPDFWRSAEYASVYDCASCHVP